MDNFYLIYEIWGKKIERRKNIVNNFLRNQFRYENNMKRGTYKATTNADRRSIIGDASYSTDFASENNKNHVFKQAFLP